ncbi:glycoside hydrolase [Streptomyces sp. NTH33]|uniref:C40 family peptidase n=1 Tax=Streptomyces sp. NTH33 TaxID=1735453 RepID=UPI000DAA7DE6|nr:NlpC/P60 family protein [Streptomyces sp. NTH33]PZH04257.1 glycoside hydrolase [Streptomyces sp. NTH33]
MASHRKAHPAATRVSPAPATAALASAALVSQPSGAAPSDDGGRPSLEEVERKLDYLYGRTGSATVRQTPQGEQEKQEKGTRQRGRVAALLDDVAKRADVLGKARQRRGSFTAAPYRTGDTAPEIAALLLAETPQGYFDQAQVMSRLNARHKGLAGGRATRPAAPPRPWEAPRAPEPPAEPQYDIAAAKAAMQKKLAHARVLLPAATAWEAAAPEPLEPTGPGLPDPAPSGPAWSGPAPFEPTPSGLAPAGPALPGPAPSGPALPGPAPSSPASPGPAPDSAYATYATKAGKALAFARAQVGKPCVWGASGPGSYDCSGLTQAAWRAAGVTLPRATRDQANAGTAVPLAEARPGDLVFLASPSGDTDHVGVYAGDGVMIHAPGPGAYVREESIRHDGETSVHHVVRPA